MHSPFCFFFFFFGSSKIDFWQPLVVNDIISKMISEIRTRVLKEEEEEEEQGQEEREKIRKKKKLK